MNITKLTNIFQYTSQPVNPAQAIPHTAGWSESVWTSLNATAYDPLWTIWATKRALLLCGAAAIIGYRAQVYTISGNKLLPGGSSSGRWLLPGVVANGADIPQAALSISGGTNGAPNTSNLLIRGIPDIFITGGEFNPTPAYNAALTAYANSLKGNNFGFPGRDLSQPSGRVISYAANVLTLDGNIGGAELTGWIRFHRCYDNAGNPVKGTYQIAGINLNVYTLSRGPLQVVNNPSGTARIDLIAYYPYSSFATGRIGVKKVGRPLQGYRGRRSKARI